MQDPFTGQITRIRGRQLPDARQRAAIQDDHERRLAALARLGAAAQECGLRADSDCDLVLLAEDEVSLLEGAGGAWTELGAAIHAFRRLLPLHALEDFGFPPDSPSPMEEPNPRLRYLHSGVEASAFISVAEGSIYKFYLPREEKRIGSMFDFRPGEEAEWDAVAGLGDYQALMEKLLLIHALDGMATEVVAITPEGILVAKQTLGDPLAQDADVSLLLPASLIEIPSRFLRANRDHPRLFFFDDLAWLVADLHSRNFVRDPEGRLRVIDLVAAPWPVAEESIDPLISDWLERVRLNPAAGLMRAVNDDEL